MRLSKYLKDKFPEFSSKEIKRALENGACQVNGKIETFSSREIDVKKDKINFQKKKFKAQEKLVIKKSHIIFADDDLLVYDKEAGHACMQTQNNKANLHEELKKFLKLSFLEPAHRLDKETSGLMIFCKNKKSLTAITNQFKNKSIKKTYYAVVDGRWALAPEGQIKNFLTLDFKKNALQKWKVAKVKNEQAQKSPSKYKLAITNYKIEKTFAKHSLIKLMPQTGRTHQLRVQLAALKYPILGDSFYAESFKHPKLLQRHLLHAFALELQHPQSKEKLLLTSTIPKEFNLS
jgi:23S rRNA pseudouridine1911/1915/1917 synthase